MKALQERGHVVAMIGDGVNDVLAIKDADFGIAMGSGADASRAIAQLILLTNDFSVLPGVISEGRRIIANIERTANLFLTKTAYVFAMALAVGLAQVPFPFLPRHLTLVGFLLSARRLCSCHSCPIMLGLTAVLSHVCFIGPFLPAGLPPPLHLWGMPLRAKSCLWMSASLVTAATLTLVGCGFSVLVLLATSDAMAKAFHKCVDCCALRHHCQSLASHFLCAGTPASVCLGSHRDIGHSLLLRAESDLAMNARRNFVYRG